MRVEVIVRRDNGDTLSRTLPVEASAYGNKISVEDLRISCRAAFDNVATQAVEQGWIQ